MLVSYAFHYASISSYQHIRISSIANVNVCTISNGDYFLKQRWTEITCGLDVCVFMTGLGVFWTYKSFLKDNTIDSLCYMITYPQIDLYHHKLGKLAILIDCFKYRTWKAWPFSQCNFITFRLWKTVNKSIY